MPNIGDKIKEARLQRGMTQADLAQDLVTPSMISQIEAGKAKPSYTLLTSIANRLGMQIEYFLEDLDDQFNLGAQIRFAEYWLSTGKPHTALDVLQSIPAPSTPGRTYQEYHYARARALRMLGRHEEAISSLEDLREQALRTLDRRLEFFVCRESGQVEYAINNFLGAMHEWRKALRIAESTDMDMDMPSAQFHAEVIELLLAMHGAYRDQEQMEEAANILQKAQVMAASHSSLHDIAMQYAQDARIALDRNDAGRAKGLAETALAIRQATGWVTQHLHIASLTTHGSTWTRAAVAMSDEQPTSLLHVELDRVSRLIKQGHDSLAKTALDQCNSQLDEYRTVIGCDDLDAQDVESRIGLLQAELFYRSGAVAEATHHLKGVRQHLEPSVKGNSLWLTATTQLLRWYVVLGDVDNVRMLSEELQSMLPAPKNW